MRDKDTKLEEQKKRGEGGEKSTELGRNKDENILTEVATKIPAYRKK